MADTKITAKGAARPIKRGTPVRPPVTPAGPVGPGQDTLQLSAAAQAAKRVPPAPVAPPPPLAFVETPAQGIPLALAGQRVLVRNGELPSAKLEVAAVAEASEPTYTMRLRETPTRLRFPGRTPEQAFERMPQVLEAALIAPAEAFPRISELAIHPDDHLAFTVQVKGAGRTVEARTVAEADGKRTIELTGGGSPLRLVVPATNNPYAGLAGAAALYAQVPAHLIAALKSLVLEAGANPEDAVWAQKYNIAGFKSAVSTGSDKITFFSGERNLSDEVFHRQFAHVLGQHFSSQNESRPDDWEAAIAADLKLDPSQPTPNPDDDFAGRWLMYLQLQLGQPPVDKDAPQTLEAFATRYPARAAILEAIYTGTRQVVDLPLQGIPLALEGRRVFIRNGERAPASLEVRPVTDASEPTFALQLRDHPTRLRFPDRTSEEARARLPLALEAALAAPREAFPHIPELAVYRDGHIAATVEVKGVPQLVEARPVAEAEGKRTFDVRTEGQTLRMVVPVTTNPHASMAEAGYLYAQVPDHLRMALKELVLEPNANPKDAEWAQKYNMPGFKSAATAGNGKATFYSGDRNLTGDVFHHEFGHVLGQRFSSKNELRPDDWDAAIAADRKVLTSYAANSPDEDFAESWWIYMMLQLGQPVSAKDAPRTLAEFATQYPARAAILEAIYAGSRKPLN